MFGVYKCVVCLIKGHSCRKAQGNYFVTAAILNAIDYGMCMLACNPGVIYNGRNREMLLQIRHC
jgi:hypothetical protein